MDYKDYKGVLVQTNKKKKVKEIIVFVFIFVFYSFLWGIWRIKNMFMNVIKMMKIFDKNR